MSTTNSTTTPENGVTYTVRLGKTFLSDSPTYHTLQYSFKPSSVETRGKLFKIPTSVNEGNLEVELLSAKQSNDSAPNYFNGNYKSTNGCVLIYEGPEKGFRLEKLTTTGNAKYQRTKPVGWGERPAEFVNTKQPTKPPLYEARDAPLPTQRSKDTTSRPKDQRSTQNPSKVEPAPAPVKTISSLLPSSIEGTQDRYSNASVVSIGLDSLPSVVTSDNEASSDDDELLKDIEDQMQEEKDQPAQSMQPVEDNAMIMETTALQEPLPSITDVQKQESSSSSSSSDSDSSSSSSSSDSSDSEAEQNPQQTVS